MKAIVWTAYGSPDVLQFKEIAKPTPGEHDILIKIYAATVTAGDCEMRSLNFPLWLWLPVQLWLGFRKPKLQVLGQELAGKVEAVGKEVTLFKAGDEVFSTTAFQLGAYAEYICLTTTAEEGALALKPTNMTYEEAATVPVGGLTALHFLRKANIQPGQTVLINGAGGSIGTIAVQLAKSFGAEVTGIDSANKLPMLRSIGADHVIDYAKEDFTKNGKTYDVILDVVGKTSYSRSIRSLTPNGCYLIANPSLSSMFRSIWTAKTSTKRVVVGASSDRTEDLIFLKELIEAGTLKTVIDRRYPLEQVAEAHHYVETGQKAGNVVITVAHA